MVKIEGLLSTKRSIPTTYKIIGAVIFVALAALATLVALGFGCCCAWSKSSSSGGKDNSTQQLSDEERDIQERLEALQANLRKHNSAKASPQPISNDRKEEAQKLMQDSTRFPLLQDLFSDHTKSESPTYSSITSKLDQKSDKYAAGESTKDELIRYAEEAEEQLDRQNIFMKLIPDNYKNSDKTDLLSVWTAALNTGIHRPDIKILSELEKLHKKYVVKKEHNFKFIEQAVGIVLRGANNGPFQQSENLSEKLNNLLENYERFPFLHPDIANVRNRTYYSFKEKLTKKRTELKMYEMSWEAIEASFQETEKQVNRHKEFMQIIPEEYKNEAGLDLASSKLSINETNKLRQIQNIHQRYVFKNAFGLEAAKKLVNTALGGASHPPF